MTNKLRTSTPSLNADYLSLLDRIDLGEIKEGNYDYIPDFLIISPPRTGTSWLWANLKCHPNIFMHEKKELKYFSSFNKMMHKDINWYLKFFEAGQGLTKGEASPSYSILPSQVMEFLKSINPNLKFIFLMRDPMERAWSHAKHNYRFREANFRFFDRDVISDSQWVENFLHEWPFSQGDYLGILRRWLFVFPKENFFVGFFDSIKSEPQKLLKKIWAHLGVETNVNWSEFPFSQPQFEGIKFDIPNHLEECLRLIYKERTEELGKFVKREFETDVPNWLGKYTTNMTQESFVVEDNHKGFSIFRCNDMFYAVLKPLNNVDIAPDEVIIYSDHAKYLVRSSLDEMKKCISELDNYDDQKEYSTKSVADILFTYEEPAYKEIVYKDIYTIFAGFGGKCYAVFNYMDGWCHPGNIPLEKKKAYIAKHWCIIGDSVKDVMNEIDKHLPVVKRAYRLKRVYRLIKSPLARYLPMVLKRRLQKLKIICVSCRLSFKKEN